MGRFEAPTSDELLEPVSELGIVKPDLYERLLGSQAVENIILGSD